MIKPENLIISLETVAGSKKVILVNTAESKVYKDGKVTEEIDGYRYEVVALDNKYEKFQVKVEGTNPIVTQEAIDASDKPIYVTFDGFEGRFYMNSQSHSYMFTAKAKNMIVLKGN